MPLIKRHFVQMLELIHKYEITGEMGVDTMERIGVNEGIKIIN